MQVAMQDGDVAFRRGEQVFRRSPRLRDDAAILFRAR